jgi:hypothetical protein
MHRIFPTPVGVRDAVWMTKMPAYRAARPAGIAKIIKDLADLNAQNLMIRGIAAATWNRFGP